MSKDENREVEAWSEAIIPALQRLTESVDRATTRNAVRVSGAEARPLTNGQSAKLAVSACRLAGFAFRETAGAAAVLRLHDGTDANTESFIPIGLAAGESVRDWFGNGISFSQGVYVEVVSGTVEGSIFVWPHR